MPRQNITPKQQLEFEKLAFNKNRGGDMVFHIFGVHKNEDHKRFEEGEEEDYDSEQQLNAHDPAPTSQRNQSPSTQTYPYVNQPPNGYSQDGSAHDAPVDNQGYQLSLGCFQGPANPIYGSNMTQSPVNDNYEMSFSTTNFTPGSSMPKGNQLHPTNSAPQAFSSSQHNQHAPIQGLFNNSPSTRRNPKFVRITMHSPRNDCWNGLVAKNDPGTEENWINSNIVDRQRFRAERGKLIKKTINFNGDVYTSGATVEATWAVQDRHMTHQTEFRVIENGPFDVVFGRSLLSSPEIDYFRDDGIDDTPILLEQSDVSPQEQAVIERNRAAADARAKENERKRRPIRPSSGSHKNSEKVKKVIGAKK
ncbi:hypothetical protein DID88_007839 [Monilinia fructigena]|uniref:Uncharacterized protein n=1 Tax=Monilinia fructigena TaxID=38457 RepID=A0A395J8L9_9HELO|nr:hypothetical protein DID88_007839 [Monilinia fructigena]